MNVLLETTNQTPIEIALGIDEQGMTTARKLYEFLELAQGQFSRWAKANITENKFAEEFIDYWTFDIDVEGNKCKDYKLTSDFAKKLSMTAKNEKGEQARDYFVTIENRAKDTQLQLQSLSPELQFLIKAEMKLNQHDQLFIEINQELEDMKDVLATNQISWREDTNKLLRKIGNNFGDSQSYQEIRNESYKLLEKRMGVNLEIRLTNKRRRMADEGVCKSKRDKLNYLDVIGDDKKLIEGYISIVRELAIKYSS